MANFKLSFVYSQPVNKGFTEVYYRTANSIREAATFDNAFLLGATQLRALITVLRKIRVSSVLGNRESVIVTVNRLGAQGADAAPDIAGSAAVVNLVSSVVPSSRRLWLRGLRDADIVRDLLSGIDAPTPQLSNMITLWIRYLSLNGFTIRSQMRVGVPPNVFSGITSVDGTIGSGLSVVHYAGVQVPAVGSRVLIAQLDPKCLPGVNGAWTVLASANGQFTIGYNMACVGIVATKTGRWRPLEFSYGGIDQGLSGFDHFGTRTTGAGFTSGRGRRRAVRLRSR